MLYARNCQALLSSLGKRAFSVIGPRLWNSLPPDTRNSSSLPIFRSRLKTHLFKIAFPPRLFPISLDCLPGFWFLLFSFMPYRMTPSVRHRAIEVHYYYYYFHEFMYVIFKFFFHHVICFVRFVGRVPNERFIYIVSLIFGLSLIETHFCDI